MSVLYHPSKGNVVADALSQLSMGSVAHDKDAKKELVHDVGRLAQLGVHLVGSNEGGIVLHNDSESSFVSDVKAKQDLDPTLVELKKSILEKSNEAFSQRGNGVLRYQDWLCVSNVEE
ncbi:hypothetical protein MTR67_030732 [Solanum verrucosum]|uniref:Uncharacterized protein n=1 Tax=Solanum verrucosum TaxID=315347 RepID=A0AAF0U152_SOLVR|nr:hypothetical protein MTR67_030732 [Solanum verrucosum]